MFLIDQHNGEVLNENEYIHKTSFSAINKVKWGDFTIIKWVPDYLRNPINVWNVHSGRILNTFGIEFNTKISNIAFH